MKKILAIIILVGSTGACLYLMVRDLGIYKMMIVMGIFVVAAFILTWCFRQLEK